MKDYTVPINDVDALIAHFAEWIRFLDAKGQELEAQLAKLEASKKKNVNGMETAVSASTLPKKPTLPAPTSTEIARITNSMDWLDDGLGSSEDADKPVSQVGPQSVDSPKADEPGLDKDNPSGDEDNSTNNPTLVSRSDTDGGDDFDWLKG